MGSAAAALPSKKQKNANVRRMNAYDKRSMLSRLAFSDVSLVVVVGGDGGYGPLPLPDNNSQVY